MRQKLAEKKAGKCIGALAQNWLSGISDGVIYSNLELSWRTIDPRRWQPIA
jgi:hypothetical protein